MPAPSSLIALLATDAPALLHTDDAVRTAIRALLRHGGFRPTGRSKPASEYLLNAVRERRLGSINLAVDACNAVSLHSGVPISVIDLDHAREPFHVRVAAPDLSYVFNASGQAMELGGLLCLFDAGGPCGNAVKDAQRTKTTPDTRKTLSLVWGSVTLPGRAAEAERWYRTLLEEQGAMTFDADPR